MTNKISNIFIIGYMGSGKSTVGRILANKLNRTFLDMDEVIEKEQDLSVNQIFMKLGEHSFRNYEAELLDKIADGTINENEGLIISCGGGIILDDENRKILEKEFVILLDCSPDIMFDRIRNNTNLPNAYFHIKDEDERKSIFVKQYRQREKLYTQCADLIVDSEPHNPEDIVAKIIKEL